MDIVVIFSDFIIKSNQIRKKLKVNKKIVTLKIIRVLRNGRCFVENQVSRSVLTNFGIFKI